MYVARNKISISPLPLYMYIYERPCEIGHLLRDGKFVLVSPDLNILGKGWKERREDGTGRRWKLGSPASLHENVPLSRLGEIGERNRHATAKAAR